MFSNLVPKAPREKQFGISGFIGGMKKAKDTLTSNADEFFAVVVTFE